MYKRVLTFITLFVVSLGIVTCSTDLTSIAPNPASDQTQLSGMDEPALSPSDEQQPLQIWWSQGFLPEENQAIIDLVEEWQQQSGIEVNLSLLPDRDILADAQKAVDKKTPPDILFSSPADTSLIPKLAWQGKLADVSELIEPMKSAYDPLALQAVYYQDKETQQRHYYAIPIGQSAVHIHYWLSFLKQAGFSEVDVPKVWDKFWAFWPQVQDRLHQKQVAGQENLDPKNSDQKKYAFGLSLSASGNDTYWEFEQFLEANDVKVVDEDGRLRVDDPDVRAGIAKVIGQLANFYQDNNVPPEAVEWTDSGNNTSFLEGESLMTVNNSLSIPVTQKQPQNPYNKESNQRYSEDIDTTVLPRKANGEQVKSLVSIKQVVMFADSQQQDAAKDFLAYLSQPDKIDAFLQKSAKGRFFPVLKELLDRPFWKGDDDRHMTTALAQYSQPDKQLLPQVYAPAYSQVLSTNVWAQAILSVIQSGRSPDQAANEAIAQIKQIFAEWQ